MRKVIELSLSPDDAAGDALKQSAARALGIEQNRLTGCSIQKRSIDARHGKVTLHFELRVAVDEPLEDPPLKMPDPQVIPGEPQVIIVGAGPAGLYAAWILAQSGVKSVILERGPDVRGRRHAVALLNREGLLDPESNYCFGEGGAGTFSDGKLYTRSNKRGEIAPFFELLVACGADPSILFDARPHLGTDRLPQIIGNWRSRLADYGVQVRFSCKVADFIRSGDRVTGVRLEDGEKIAGKAVILATGHSAPDVYQLLQASGAILQAKPFAFGVRLEHPQAFIDQMQYGKYAGYPALGAASYNIKHTFDDGIGVFSFCMCPGGTIVPSTSGEGQLVVNGMSAARRGSPYANSGFVVTVSNEGFSDAMSALVWQQKLEQKAYKFGGGAYKAPAQRLTDFCRGKASTSLPRCSYPPGVTPSNLQSLLPKSIYKPMVQALKIFDARMKGFVSDDAVAVGVESRSSSPVRVLRDPETGESPSLKGLFPCGEGSGYAGGITSAALDGAFAAKKVLIALGCAGDSLVESGN